MWNRLIDAAQVLKTGLAAPLSPVLFGVQAIALDESGRVILVRHSYRAGWWLPGGGVGRRERAESAVMRELKEEIGLVSSASPLLFGLYMRPMAWADNHIALFTVASVRWQFRRSFEIVETGAYALDDLPADLSAPARRRLDEYSGRAAADGRW